MRKLTFTFCPDKSEKEGFSTFLLREAGRSTYDAESGKWTVPVHSALDIFWLGANWERYKAQGYTFDSSMYRHQIRPKGPALKPRHQEDLTHVLSKLNHLVGHLSDLSCFVEDQKPYSIQLVCDAQKLYLDACDLLHSGQQLLKRFDPTLTFRDGGSYHPSTAWMPDMPLRCCLACKEQGDFTGMIREEGGQNA